MTNETARNPIPDHNQTGRNEISTQTKAPLRFQVYDDFDMPESSMANKSPELAAQ
jgi:hypothetical protein